jgi:proteic killer suppression protein
VEVAFRTRKLERCYRDDHVAARAFGPDVARRYIERINLIKTALGLDELLDLPGLRGHSLRGDRAGQYAIRLTGFIRLIMTVRRGTPPSVCIEEVSKHYDD